MASSIEQVFEVGHLGAFIGIWRRVAMVSPDTGANLKAFKSFWQEQLVSMAASWLRIILFLTLSFKRERQYIHLLSEDYSSDCVCENTNSEHEQSCTRLAFRQSTA